MGHLTILLRTDLQTFEFQCRKIRTQASFFFYIIDNPLQFANSIALHTLLVYRRILLQNIKYILCVINYI